MRLRQPGLTDTVRARTLYELCWELRQSDLAAARRYGEQGLALARRTGYWIGELRCLKELSGIALSGEDYFSAEKYAQELVKRAALAPPRLVRYQASGLEAVAMAAAVQDQHARAAQYYQQQLALIEAQRPALDDMLPMTYIGLSSSYYTRVKNGEKGDSVVAKGRAYAQQAQRLARRQQAPLVEAAGYQLHAMLLKELPRLDSAERLMRKALALYRANNAIYNVGAAVSELADLSVALGRPADAVVLANESRQLAHTVQDPFAEMTSYATLGRAYAALGQGTAAYKAQVRSARIGDSIKTAESALALRELQVKFDTERKESRIRDLTQQQRLQVEKVARQQQGLWALGAVLAAVAAGLVVAGALAVRLRRSRAQLADRNQQLERARASQDRLYAVVAHDLRGPLTAFQSLGPLIRYHHQQGEAEAINEIAGEVSQTADQCTRLLDNLLHYAATQAGELRYRPENLSAAALLTDISTLYASAARAARVALTVRADRALLARADRTMTLTVLRNLTHNALKVSPANAPLALAAEATPDGRVAFTITDHGPGLSPERLAELLGPAAADNIAAETGKHIHLGPEAGTGLGLPLVRQLVHRQNGEFTLASEVGCGTVARVVLPGAAAEAGRAEPPASRARKVVAAAR